MMTSGAQRQWFILTLSLMLLVALVPRCDARRGGGFGRGGGGGFGRGGGGGYSRMGGPARPVQSGGPSAGKVAGAAAAGAIGGAMLGSALSRPGYGYGYGGYGGGYGGYGGGYGGYGGYGGGPRGGYGRGYEPEGSGDMDFYYNAASSGPTYNSIIVVIGSIFALLMGTWAAVL